MSHRLSDWLASATLGLALSERGRIQEEISAHVTDAIAYQTAQGLSESDAETRAIQDLGDPQAARAAFRRTCYTLSDEQRLEKLLGRSWWTLPIGWLWVIMLFGLIIFKWLNVRVEYKGTSVLSEVTLIAGALVALASIPLYFYEPRIKRWLHKCFPARGVLAVQAFTLLLATPILYSVPIEAITFIKMILTGKSVAIIGTWMLVPFLTYRWLAQQIPLTLKTIQRTRA